MSHNQAGPNTLKQPQAALYGGLPPINNQRVTFNSFTPFTPTYVSRNVTRSSDPRSLYQSRVQGRHILLENSTNNSRAEKQREARRARRAADKSRAAAGVMGHAQAREKSLWKLDRSESRFGHFVALHRLWLGYMTELLALPPAPTNLGQSGDAFSTPNVSTMHAKLIKAEFMGALITVRQSKNPCLVGLSGIVYHETENAFKIVTPKDQQKLVPKANSIFTFSVPLFAVALPNDDASSANEETGSVGPSTVTSLSPPNETVLDLPHMEFELYGNQFCFRSADRASRKFKHKETVEL
ncbi:RNase P/MRP p29 subunit [Trametopsis cervina]|nr:RNase P/MRP p29 subunit [Trametopsis cervina]